MGKTSVALSEVKEKFLQGVEIEQWLILSHDKENFDALTQPNSSILSTNMLQQMANKDRVPSNVGQLLLALTPVSFGIKESATSAVIARKADSWHRVWSDAGRLLSPLNPLAAQYLRPCRYWGEVRRHFNL